MSEMIYDPLEVSSYARHLAKVNESKQVLATDDICNEQGVVLVKSGCPINVATAQRIVKFKLLKPIEEYVSIEGDVSGSVLYHDINQIIAKGDVSRRTHEQYELQSELKWLCSYYHTFPLIRQKMTVLSMQMVRVYRQSLFCAWLTILIAKKMGLPQQDFESLFLAALSHDIGMLHIDERILSKKEALTPEEWRHIYAHPLIGEQIMLSIPGVSKDAAQAVREHHEKCDGTGYPAGRFAAELSTLGKILALADTVVVIVDRMRKQGRGFRDMMPVLQINAEAYSGSICNAFISALKKIELGDKSSLSADNLESYVDGLLAKKKLLRIRLETAEAVVMPLGFSHSNRKLHSLQTLLMQTGMAVRGAGLLDQSYVEFLRSVKADIKKAVFREIEDVGIMLDEVSYHLNRVLRMMEEFVEYDKGQDEEPKHAFVSALQTIKDAEVELAAK